MLHIYGFDPGKTTGYCHVSVENRVFKPLEIKEMKPEETLDWCATFINEFEEEDDTVIFIVEDYTILPKQYQYDHQGDKGIPMQLIGALKLTALTLGLEFVLQIPGVKPAGYGFLKQKYQRGKRGYHIQDAVAHVSYFAVTRNIVDTATPQTHSPTVVPMRSSHRISRQESVHVWRNKDTQPGLGNDDKSS